MSHVPQALQTDGDVLVDIIVDFLVAFTHQVLYYRNLYPPSIFERRRLYNIAVQRARHPDLCSYIQNTIDGLKVPRDLDTLIDLSTIICHRVQIQFQS